MFLIPTVSSNALVVEMSLVSTFLSVCFLSFFHRKLPLPVESLLYAYLFHIILSFFSAFVYPSTFISGHAPKLQHTHNAMSGQ